MGGILPYSKNREKPYSEGSCAKGRHGMNSESLWLILPSVESSIGKWKMKAADGEGRKNSFHLPDKAFPWEGKVGERSSLG